MNIFRFVNEPESRLCRNEFAKIPKNTVLRSIFLLFFAWLCLSYNALWAFRIFEVLVFFRIRACSLRKNTSRTRFHCQNKTSKGMQVFKLQSIIGQYSFQVFHNRYCHAAWVIWKSISCIARTRNAVLQNLFGGRIRSIGVSFCRKQGMLFAYDFFRGQRINKSAIDSVCLLIF